MLRERELRDFRCWTTEGRALVVLMREVEVGQQPDEVEPRERQGVYSCRGLQSRMGAEVVKSFVSCGQLVVWIFLRYICFLNPITAHMKIVNHRKKRR